jgi:hypothetical protein
LQVKSEIDVVAAGNEAAALFNIEKEQLRRLAPWRHQQVATNEPLLAPSF